jgi:hypothetical protein
MGGNEDQTKNLLALWSGAVWTHKEDPLSVDVLKSQKIFSEKMDDFFNKMSEQSFVLQNPEKNTIHRLMLSISINRDSADLNYALQFYINLEKNQDSKNNEIIEMAKQIFQVQDGFKIEKIRVNTDSDTPVCSVVPDVDTGFAVSDALYALRISLVNYSTSIQNSTFQKIYPFKNYWQNILKPTKPRFKYKNLNGEVTDLSAKDRILIPAGIQKYADTIVNDTEEIVMNFNLADFFCSIPEENQRVNMPMFFHFMIFKYLPIAQTTLFANSYLMVRNPQFGTFFIESVQTLGRMSTTYFEKKS